MSSTYCSSSFQLENILVSFRKIKERLVIFLVWGGAGGMGGPVISVLESEWSSPGSSPGPRHFIFTVPLSTTRCINGHRWIVRGGDYNSCFRNLIDHQELVSLKNFSSY